MIYLVPQYPAKNRYTEDWIKWLKSAFGKEGRLVIGKEKSAEFKYSDINIFTDTKKTALYELQALEALIKIPFVRGDKIFFADIDFTGVCLPICILLKRMYPYLKFYGYVHATSLNRGDYWEGLKEYKLPLEKVTFKLFDKLFVATEYHRKKLLRSGETVVVGAPFYGFSQRKVAWDKRKWDVVIVSRPQKSVLDKLGEKEYLIEKGIKVFIVRNKTRKEYREILANSKICLSWRMKKLLGIV